MGEFIFTILNSILNVLLIAIFVRMILSWVRVDPYHPAVQFLHRITEPILAPIRQLMPQAGMMDFSPIVAYFIIIIIQRLLAVLLR